MDCRDNPVDTAKIVSCVIQYPLAESKHKMGKVGYHEAGKNPKDEDQLKGKLGIGPKALSCLQTTAELGRRRQ